MYAEMALFVLFNANDHIRAWLVQWECLCLKFAIQAPYIVYYEKKHKKTYKKQKSKVDLE